MRKNIDSWWRRQWHPTPVLLPGKPYGQRSLVGCSPWGRKELDTTERLHIYFSLSCIGEGNGNPLQCFCLENPRDGGAWWAAVYGVTQSRTRLKWLSSSMFNWALVSLGRWKLLTDLEVTVACQTCEQILPSPARLLCLARKVLPSITETSEEHLLEQRKNVSPPHTRVRFQDDFSRLTHS